MNIRFFYEGKEVKEFTWEQRHIMTMKMAAAFGAVPVDEGGQNGKDNKYNSGNTGVNTANNS
jgi:hypothetical protein